MVTGLTPAYRSSFMSFVLHSSCWLLSVQQDGGNTPSGPLRSTRGTAVIYMGGEVEVLTQHPEWCLYPTAAPNRGRLHSLHFTLPILKYRLAPSTPHTLLFFICSPSLAWAGRPLGQWEGGVRGGGGRGGNSRRRHFVRRGVRDGRPLTLFLDHQQNTVQQRHLRSD